MLIFSALLSYCSLNRKMKMHFRTTQSFFVSFGVLLLAFINGDASATTRYGCKVDEHGKYSPLSLYSGPGQEEAIKEKLRFYGVKEENNVLNIDRAKHITLINKLEEINGEILLDTVVNNVDNFIDFYNMCEQNELNADSCFNKLFKKAHVDDRYVNQNLLALERIVDDEEIKKMFPNIADCVFLAATIPNGKESIKNNLNKGGALNIEDINNFIPHTTAAIRISYYDEEDVKKSFARFGRETNSRLGHIFLDPEYNWVKPITVMMDHSYDKYPNTDWFDSFLMEPDYSFLMDTNYICPILQKDLRGWSMRKYRTSFRVLPNNTNYVTPFFAKDDPLRDTLGQIIYTGMPYCHFQDHTEKLKSLSPFRGLFKRNIDGLANFGIFAIVSTKVKREKYVPELDVITTDKDNEVRVQKYEFQKFLENDSKAFIKKLQPVLDVIEKQLKLGSGELLQKLNSLAKIMVQDPPFLDDIRHLHENKETKMQVPKFPWKRGGTLKLLPKDFKKGRCPIKSLFSDKV